MKTIQKIIKPILLLTVYCSINTLFAQAPQKMNYQAVIRNSSNALVINTTVAIRVSVLLASETGSEVFVERNTTTTDLNGLATIEIGTGTSILGTFAAINWGTGTYFIKTETDPAGGANYNIVGTSQLSSVPYALNARTSADNKWAANSNGINNISGNVGIGNSNPSYNLDISKRMRLRSETTSLGAGIWFNKNDNSSENVFLGNDVSNNLQVYSLAGNRTIANFNPTTGGFRVEGPAIASPTVNTFSIGGNGKVEVDAPGVVGGRFNIQENGNVGIGTSTPNAPLSFPPTLGKKITLYPGQTGDVGFGVAGNRLQLYTDNPNADVAIGYDAAGVFNEKLAVKANGAIAVNGTMGGIGQVLTSAGANGQVVWSNPLNVVQASWNLNSNATTITSLEQFVQSRIVSIPAGQNALLLISAKIQIYPTGCTGLGCQPRAQANFYIDGQLVESTIFNMDSNNTTQEYVISNFPKIVSPGNHNYNITVGKVNGETNNFTTHVRNNTLLIIPQ